MHQNRIVYMGVTESWILDFVDGCQKGSQESMLN